MNNGILSLALLAFIAFAVPANAALVNIATNTLASPSRVVLGPGGNPIPLGSIVRIGTFPAGLPAGVCLPFAAWNAAFVPIGEDPVDPNDGTNGPGTINSSTAGGSGWAFTINNVQNSDPRFAPNTRLYIMVLDAPPVEMFTTSSMLLMSDPLWTIPASGARTMTTAQIDQPSELLYGFFVGSNQIQMPLWCPEPSASAIGLLAGLCALTRRRR